MNKYQHSEITGQVIKAFCEVYNTLGYGFFERVYENALRIELKKQGVRVVQQSPIKVYYKKQLAGEFYSECRHTGRWVSGLLERS